MIEQYKELLKERLKEKRMIHSLNVADCAQRLALKYGCDGDRAYVAGLLHDVCKNDPLEKMLQMFDEFGIILTNIEKKDDKLWHAIAGALYAKHVLGLDDDSVQAIRYHTTAKENMSLLSKIIYIADFISEDRDYPGVEELREAAEQSLEQAMRKALKFIICELTEREKPIHQDTFAAYNEIMLSV